MRHICLPPVAVLFTCLLQANSPLHLASAKGDLQAVQTLVESGADLNLRDEDGLSPLMMATRYKQCEVVAYLLEKGADPNLQTTAPVNGWPVGTTALMMAATYDHGKLFNHLIRNGSRPEIQNERGETVALILKQTGMNKLKGLFRTKSEAPSCPEMAGLGTTKASKAQAPRRYSKALIDIEVLDGVDYHYPEAASQCRASVLQELADRALFKEVKGLEPGEKPVRDEATLMVKAQISELRIVGRAGRIILGPLRGSSRASAKLSLGCALDGQVELEVDVQTSSSAWAGSGTVGSTDQNIPLYLGWEIAKAVEKAFKDGKLQWETGRK